MTKTGFSGDNSPSSLSTSWRSDLNINVLKNKKKGKSIKKKKKNDNAMNIDKTYVFVSSRLGNSLLLGLSTETTDSKDDNDNTKKRTNDTIKTETNSAKKRNRKEDDAEDGKYFIAKESVHRVYGKHCSLTFLFLLPLSNLLHCLCHVSPSILKQVFLLTQ